MGLSNVSGDSTLMSTIVPCSKNSYAKQLRKKQNASASYRHVSNGVKHFKAGETSEAFQCLNAALRIDEENVEGYVARGALYANNGSLSKAIEDFETALKLNKDHKNAVKYLHETLLALGQNYENENNVVRANETYHKLLTRDPDNSKAREKLYFLMLNSGKGSEKEKNFEEAIKYYSKAMETDTRDKEAKCRLLSLKLRYKGTNIEQRIHEILQRFESDNKDKKHHNKSSTRYKSNSATSIENTNMKEKKIELCDKKMFIEKNVKDGLREDSFLKQYD